MKAFFGDDSDEETGRRKGLEDDDDEDDERPSSKRAKLGPGDGDEEDDLDAYMAQINQQAKDNASKRRVEPTPFEKEEDDDPVTSYMAFRDEKAIEVASAAKEAEDSGASESNATDSGAEEEGGEPKKKSIASVAALDHDAINYAAFRKEFYKAHPDIATLSPQEVYELRKELGVKVSGSGVIPAPVRTFAELNSLGRELLDAIKRHGYEIPSEIQSQAIPIIMSGRDAIGIAKTGSGKTAAFVLPLLVHAMDQPRIGQSEGPIGLIVAPTRELAHQIAHEAKRFGKSLGIKVTLIVGGDPKFEQYKALRDGGAEIVVGTPGRLLDMVKMKACTFKRCTYLVLDEADRMFDMGFEPQVRSVIGQIRPDRQTALFSATFKPMVERLASSALRDPVRIVVGSVGAVNENVKQIVEVFGNDDQKLQWLKQRIPQLSSEGGVVIFALTRGGCAELANNLRAAGFPTCSIHGETDQADREGMMRMFKRQEVKLLVATDIAARGLDIKHVKNVVNYEPAKNIDWHTHRIGRTGRAGQKGTAYTLLTSRNSSFAELLMRSFQRSDQPVPPALAALASRKSGAPRGGRGRGFSFDQRGRGHRGGRGGRDGNTGSRANISFVRSSE